MIADQIADQKVVSYYTQRELQPLKGTLELYRSALLHINQYWHATDLAMLQSKAQDIVPEAALFTVWNRLRIVNLTDDGEATRVREYLRSVDQALAKLLSGNYEAVDLGTVRDLGTIPSRVADRYDALLRQNT